MVGPHRRVGEDTMDQPGTTPNEIYLPPATHHERASARPAQGAFARLLVAWKLHQAEEEEQRIRERGDRQGLPTQKECDTTQQSGADTQT